MSKIQNVALLSLLAVLLCQAGLVEAICGHCYGSHACINETTAVICFDGVPNANYTIPCPTATPICTQYGDMCMANLTGVVTPACGDTSLCNQCSGTQVFACTSRTSFGYCSNGAVEGTARITCPANNFCSVSGAAEGTPCVVSCEPDASDTCDRDSDDSDDIITTTENPSNGTTTTETPSNGTTTTETPSNGTTTTETPSNGTTTTPSTITTTTAATPTDANSFCQLQQSTSRYAIPNDTVCTSYIHCSYKGGWLGYVLDCPTTKPYFLATATVCGTVQPTRAGCLA